MLHVIIDPERGTQEIPTPQKVASRKSVRRRQQHRYMNTSDQNQNRRGAPRSVLGITATGFGDSSEDPSGSTSDKTTKYPSTVPIIKPASVPSETTTKDTSKVTKKLPIYKPSNMLI